MLPKSKIRLSRSLRAQTTPYPNATRWLKRGIIVVMLLLGLGVYLLGQPDRSKPSPDLPAGRQEILGEQQGTTEYLLYTVKKGDTLFNLSQRYGVSWQTLAELNNLEEPYLLKIGQEIKIPQTQ